MDYLVCSSTKWLTRLESISKDKGYLCILVDIKVITIRHISVAWSLRPHYIRNRTYGLKQTFVASKRTQSYLKEVSLDRPILCHTFTAAVSYRFENA